MENTFKEKYPFEKRKNEAEKELMHRLVIGLGFEQNEANSIIEKSFKEIIKGSDEDEFIAAF